MKSKMNHLVLIKCPMLTPKTNKVQLKIGTITIRSSNKGLNHWTGRIFCRMKISQRTLLSLMSLKGRIDLSRQGRLRVCLLMGGIMMRLMIGFSSLFWGRIRKIVRLREKIGILVCLLLNNDFFGMNTF